MNPAGPVAKDSAPPHTHTVAGPPRSASQFTALNPFQALS